MARWFIIVVATVLVALMMVSASFYFIAVKPVPISTKNDPITYTWKNKFSSLIAANNALCMKNTSSTTRIIASGLQNSSLEISVYGVECLNSAMYPPASVFCFDLVVNGNLSSKLHPKSLIVSQTVEAFSPNSTEALSGRYLDCINVHPFWQKLTNLTAPTSYKSALDGPGTLFCQYTIKNDTSLLADSNFHFRMSAPGSAGNWTAGSIYNSFYFYPNSFNMTYHVLFQAELTGLSEPVNATVELILADS